MATKIKLKMARLAFPELFTPGTVNGEGEPAYSASFIIEKDHPQHAEINAAIEAEAKAKWGAKAAAILTAARKTDKVCLHDGDGKPYEGFAGNDYISARNPVRPKLKALNGRDDLQQSDGVLYSGCYVMAVLELWAQDNSYGKRVNATVLGVQFMQDGDAFTGGGTASDDDFDDLGSAEADDLT